MKTVLTRFAGIVCLLLAGFCGRAQNPNDDALDSAYTSSHIREDDTTFWVRNRYIFGQLDTARIASGILSDYGYAFTDLPAYDGSISDSNWCSFRTVEAINTSLYSSRICSRGNDSALPTPEQLYDRYKAHNGPLHFALSAILVRYQAFRPDAIDYLDTLDGQLYDKYIGGVWQDPYETRTVFAMGLPSGILQGDSMQLVLPPDLWISNMKDEVQGIRLDADDGLGWRNLVPGQALVIRYDGEGEKEIRMEITELNSTVRLTRSRLTVLFRATAEQDTVKAAEPYMGLRGEAIMRIQYADPDHILRRPLIVVEGFDPGHIVAVNSPYGETDIAKVFNYALSNVIPSLNELNNQINNNDYDLVFVDWVNGTDYIQRNALALKQVIREVNARKQPYAGVRQPNVLWGMSMGGLAARYALKDMEDHSESHEVRLFISHDAPHQGAHVPAGYQMMADHLRSIWLGTGSLKDMVHTLVIPATGLLSVNDALTVQYQPAAVQMLSTQLSAWGKAQHVAWRDELRIKGYPALCRNVAISNGSECGMDQPLEPGQLQFGIRGSVTLTLIADAFLRLTALHTELSSILGGLRPPSLLGIIPGSSSWEADFAVRGDADGTDHEVYYGRIDFMKRVAGAIPIYSRLSKETLRRDKALARETFSGGYFSYGDVYPVDLSFKSLFFKYYTTFDLTNRFSFVPAASALDISGGVRILSKNWYRSRYIGMDPPPAPYQTPFANFITEYNNSSLALNNVFHTEINARNAEFAGREIGSIYTPVHCAAPCIDANGIYGPSSACAGANSYNVVLTNPSPAPAVSWGLSTDPPGIATLSTSGTSCTINVTGFGTATLYCFLSTTCNNTPTYTKKISIGAPDYSYFSLSNAYVSGGGYKTIVNPYIPSFTYTWSESYYPPGSMTLSTTAGTAGGSEYRILHPTTPGMPFAERVYVNISNGCGSTTLFINKPSAGPGWRVVPDDSSSAVSETLPGKLIVYPNPADEAWNISREQADERVPVSVELSDITGRCVFSRSFTGHHCTIPNTHLLPGLYLLRVESGNTRQFVKLIKQ